MPSNHQFAVFILGRKLDVTMNTALIGRVFRFISLAIKVDQELLLLLLRMSSCFPLAFLEQDLLIPVV